jgi:SagB-type dehydrogenase family enzyme
MNFLKPTVIAAYLLVFCTMAFSQQDKRAGIINLPVVQFSPDQPLITLLQNRQSVREFKNQSLTLEQVSLMLWAAAGKKMDAISAASRTVPSAGACHPIEVYLLIQPQGIKNLKAGLYRYQVDDHSLQALPVSLDEKAFIAACQNQAFVAKSPITLIIAACFQKTSHRYGPRGEHYVFLDAGHVGQNIYLMATQLGLATVEVGAFDDMKLAKYLNLPEQLKPILVMPVGYAK